MQAGMQACEVGYSDYLTYRIRSDYRMDLLAEARDPVQLRTWHLLQHIVSG